MELVYRVGNSLYLNLTNRCSCACTFCLRQDNDTVGESQSLWLEREPTAQEMIEAIKAADTDGRSEMVFCGFGEPTCALDVLLETAAWMKNNLGLPIRLNTNGQGNLINGRDISSDLAKYVDTVSVSLNDPDPVRYQQLVRSKFGDQAFPGMLTFAENCVKAGMNVVMTTVDTTISHEDEDKCRQICSRIGASYRIREWIA